MNKFIKIIIVFLLSAPASARDLVIALSPYQSQRNATAQVKTILQFLTTLEPGQKALLLDGYHLKSIGQFTVPSGAAYTSPKARLKANRASVAALLGFAKASALRQDLSAGALRTPQALRHIAENYAHDTEIDVILLGSPFYDDAAAPHYSMADAYVPSDGHIKASRAKTPFGTTDHPDLLKNMRVHVGFGDERMMLSDRHRFFVQRFWTLFIEAQGGTLISFSADAPALFERVRAHAAPINHAYKIGKETTLEMIRLRREEITPSIYDEPVSSAPLKARHLRRAGHVQIGLSWDCETCDLDLYARPWPDAELIYFNRSTTAQGSHWKDYLSAPRGKNLYETIEFNVPLDLRKLQIVINFYNGVAQQTIKGEIRIAVDGQVFAAPFTMDAKTGNQGGDVAKAFQSDRASHPQTRAIDALHLVGLR